MEYDYSKMSLEDLEDRYHELHGILEETDFGTEAYVDLEYEINEIESHVERFYSPEEDELDDSEETIFDCDNPEECPHN